MKNELKILLASPRGFCAGVDRAIEIVNKALNKHGKPVYVRHEIVHNKQVVEDLKKRGAIFVEEISDIEDKTRPVIFSAHGVPKKIPEDAKNYNMTYVDATCPLVSKVHREAENLNKAGYHLILIGHQNHPEVIGTMGQLPPGTINEVYQEYIQFYKNIAQFYANTKFLLFNYPGQMFTIYNKKKYFTNEELSQILDGFMHFLDDINEINIDKDVFMFVGIGFGGFVLSHYRIFFIDFSKIITI